MGTKRIERRLRKAMAEQRFVRLYRQKEWDELSGYVAAVGSKWVLLADIDGQIRPDGFCALRLRDIVEVRRVTASETFHRALLERHGDWPPAQPPPGIALDRTRRLVRGLADVYPIVVVHTERADPHVCFVGRVVGTRKKSLGLQEITPNAVWDVDANRYYFDEISRIDVGDGYSAALREVGGEPPTWPGPAS